MIVSVPSLSNGPSRVSSRNGEEEAEATTVAAVAGAAAPSAAAASAANASFMGFMSLALLRSFVAPAFRKNSSGYSVTLRRVGSAEKVLGFVLSSVKWIG